MYLSSTLTTTTTTINLIKLKKYFLIEESNLNKEKNLDSLNLKNSILIRPNKVKKLKFKKYNIFYKP